MVHSFSDLSALLLDPIISLLTFWKWSLNLVEEALRVRYFKNCNFLVVTLLDIAFWIVHPPDVTVILLMACSSFWSHRFILLNFLICFLNERDHEFDKVFFFKSCRDEIRKKTWALFDLRSIPVLIAWPNSQKHPNFKQIVNSQKILLKLDLLFIKTF